MGNIIIKFNQLLSPSEPISPTRINQMFDCTVTVDDGAIKANMLSLTNLVNAVDDAAAETAGGAIGQLYRNGSILMVRVT